MIKQACHKAWGFLLWKNYCTHYLSRSYILSDTHAASTPPVLGELKEIVKLLLVTSTHSPGLTDTDYISVLSFLAHATFKNISISFANSFQARHSHGFLSQLCRAFFQCGDRASLRSMTTQTQHKTLE